MVLSKVCRSNGIYSIAGSGSPLYIEFLRSKVEELGLSKQVEFVGEVFEENKDALFAQSDVALVPSYVENFGIVVAESLAHAVPVIASKGTPWMGLETNKCGLWVATILKAWQPQFAKFAP